MIAWATLSLLKRFGHGKTLTGRFYSAGQYLARGLPYF
jgi:hypothetical protein